MRGAAVACLTSAAVMLMAAAGAARAAAPLGAPGAPVPIGPGAIESSVRQVVRTLDGRVYVVLVDDHGRSGPTRVRMFEATGPGVPTRFVERDAAHALSEPGGVFSGVTLAGGDARLDRGGVIHVALFDSASGAVIHQAFDTKVNLWRAAQTVATYADIADNPSGDHPFATASGIRGAVNTAIAVEPGVVTLVATDRHSVNAYVRRSGASWIGVRIFTAPRSDINEIHPALTTDRLGRLHLAWLEDRGSAGPPAIRYAVRSPTGVWTVEGKPLPAASGVQPNTTEDQGPSIAVDAANRPVVLFISGHDADNVRVDARRAGGWWVDESPPAVFAHTPAVYARADDVYALLGHDVNIHPGYLTRDHANGVWSSVRPFETRAPYDGSASARFDPAFETDCTIVDAVFFDEDTADNGTFRPTAYYEPIGLAGARSGHGGCRELASAAARPRPRVRATLRLSWVRRPDWTVVRSLVLRHVTAGARVRARCRGRGCARGSVTARGGRTIRLTPLTHRRLWPGAVIRIRVAKTGFRARSFRIAIRRGRAPAVARAAAAQGP